MLPLMLPIVICFAMYFVLIYGVVILQFRPQWQHEKQAMWKLSTVARRVKFSLALKAAQRHLIKHLSFFPFDGRFVVL